MRACGMTYLHVPFSLRHPARATAAVDEFRRQMSAPPGRTLVHCGSGRRAAALSAIHLGLREGMRSEDVLGMARNWGLPIEPPELADFVADSAQKAKYLHTAAMVAAQERSDLDQALAFQHAPPGAHAPQQSDVRRGRA